MYLATTVDLLFWLTICVVGSTRYGITVCASMLIISSKVINKFRNLSNNYCHCIKDQNNSVQLVHPAFHFPFHFHSISCFSICPSRGGYIRASGLRGNGKRKRKTETETETKMQKEKKRASYSTASRTVFYIVHSWLGCYMLGRGETEFCSCTTHLIVQSISSPFEHCGFYSISG